MCFNRRVLIGLGFAALVVLAMAPKALGAVLPIILLAACPLSMLVMMREMRRTRSCAPTTEAADTDQIRHLKEELKRLANEIEVPGGRPPD